MTPTRARAVALTAFGRGLIPPPDVSPADWGRQHLYMPDGPAAGRRWDPDLTPQLSGILDCLAPAHPCVRVTVRKSGQVGFTAGAIAWLGSIIDVTPAQTMVVFPTILGVQDFGREKLGPALEQSPRLRAKVRDQKSRSGSGSTALSKRFPGGALILTGANSSADLRSKSIRYVFADEIDEWPLDLNGQGDPMGMVDARQISHHAAGDYKKLEGSTPTVRGVSRVDAAFEEGDQRYWMCPCPDCGASQRLVFKNLVFNTEAPYDAHYQCAECGVLIPHHRKRQMVLSGAWVATVEGPGRHPSFHLDALTSLLTTWDNIAEAFVRAKDDPKRLKSFVNLWLGQSWEERGDAPEWEHLYARREEYPSRTLPPGCLLVTVGVDVQANGVFFEAVGWGEGRESWSLDCGFLAGDTSDPAAQVWRDLDAVYHRGYPDAFGNVRPLDAMAVDSGFNTNVVYGWARSRPKAFAIKGIDGWYAPAIGLPSKQDVSWGGRRLKGGAESWPVGTWSLKSELYANLRKKGLREGSPEDPPGYCHFAAHNDQDYFRQLTAEALVEVTAKGRTAKVWRASGANHLHDCRIYAMAMAEKLGMSRMSSDDWAKIRAVRECPPARDQGDLFAAPLPEVARAVPVPSDGPAPGADPVQAGALPVAPVAAVVARQAGGFLGRSGGRSGSWINRR